MFLNEKYHTLQYQTKTKNESDRIQTLNCMVIKIKFCFIN